MATRKLEDVVSRRSTSRSKRHGKGPLPGEPTAEVGRRTDVPLREAADEWQRTFDAIPEPICILDTQHRIVRLNRDMANGLGLTKDQCVGQTCYRVVHGTDAPPSFCPYSQLLQDGKEHTVEVQEERFGGDFLVSVSPLRDPDGQLCGCVHFARDTSSCKQVVEGLKSACARLESLWTVASLSDTSVKSVADHILASIVRMTKSQYGFHGFLNEDESVMTIYAWSGEAMRDCSMVDKPQRFLISEAGIWGEAVRRRAPLILNDYSAVHVGKKRVPEGHVPLGRLLVVPHFSQGRISAVAAVANRSADYTRDDITQITSFLRSVDAIVQSAKAQEALQQSENRFASAFDYSAIGMALVSPEGRWLKVNRAVCGILGYTQEELLVRTFQDITHPDDLEADMACVRQMLDGELQTYQMEKRYYHKAGHTVRALLSVSVVRDARGKPLYFVVQIQDVTDRKRAEEAMQRLQKTQIEAEKLAATGRMAARVAHEINNPLAGIQNSFHLIRDAVPKTHPDHDMVERIDREIERIANVVRQMYTLYSPRTETITDVKVADAIQDMLMMLEPLRREHEVQFDVGQIHPGLTVRVTKGGLHQTLYNMVTNAVEASPRGGTVELVAELTDDKRGECAARISVRDHGSGIPPELCGQIFEPLFTTKADDGIKGGLGLGLPIVKGIVESVGGKIDFESTPGQGTVFHVLLPQGAELREG